jgi:hypothetical protein
MNALVRGGRWRWFGLGVGSVVLASAACVEQPEQPPPAACVAGAWCWENPLPQGNGLFAVWQSGPNSAVVVGGNGAILQRRDGVWQVDDSGTSRALFAAWGTSDRNMWVVGELGTILRFDGSAWRAVDSGTTSTLNGISGTAANDVWVTGDAATALHWDGGAWAATAVPPGTDLGDVWANAADDVWAAGVRQVDGYPAGVVIHWDGSAWVDALVDGQPEINTRFGAIWSSGPADVWVGGTSAFERIPVPTGTLRHFDGASWTTSPVSINALEHRPISHLWGSGPYDVWAASGGFPTTALHFDGTAWHASADENTMTMTAVHGRGADNAVAVTGSGRVVHWDGASWNDWHRDVTADDIVDAWADRPDSIWAVTASAILHHDGRGWSVAYDVAGPPFTAVSGGAGVVWALRRDGTLASWTDEAGKLDEPAVRGVPDMQFADLWASPAGDFELWAAANSTLAPTSFGAGRVFRRPPGSFDWLEVPVPVAPPEGLRSLTAVSASSTSDVWVAGLDTTVYRFDGSAWTAIPVPGAVGFFRDIWVNTATDVWLPGGHHWTGETFAPTGLATDRAFNFLWSDGPSNVWIVGSEGAVAHFDGAGWTPIETGVTRHWNAVWGTSDGAIRLFGGFGAIVRR